MSRRGENIYKRKDGRWEGRFLKGQRHSKPYYGYVYAKSYKEVKAKLQASKDEYRMKYNQEYFGDEPLDVPLSGVYPAWLARKATQMKESTLAKYTALYRRYLEPEFGDVLLSEISEKAISDYSAMLAVSGGSKKSGLSSKTISDALCVLKNILQFAQKNNYVVNESALRTSSPKTCAPTLRILSISEQEKIVSYIKGDPSNSNIGILLSLFTGIRIGELCALTWDDIDLVENTLHIHKTMQRLPDESSTDNKTKIVITSPKSACSNRIVPFPDIVTAYIPAKKKCSGFFLTGSETKYIEPRTMENRFNKLLEECGIEHVHFHTLRHTFATRCVEIGFDIKSLSEILGHSNINITLNRYVHPSMQLKKKSMSKLSNLFSVK